MDQHDMEPNAYYVVVDKVQIDNEYGLHTPTSSATWRTEAIIAPYALTYNISDKLFG